MLQMMMKIHNGIPKSCIFPNIDHINGTLLSLWKLLYKNLSKNYSTSTSVADKTAPIELFTHTSQIIPF